MCYQHRMTGDQGIPFSHIPVSCLQGASEKNLINFSTDFVRALSKKWSFYGNKVTARSKL